MAALQLPMFCQIYLDEIRAATSDFAELEKIRADGFGTIYRGEILYGTNRVHVAIKRLNATSVQMGFKQGIFIRFAPGFKDFYVEVNALSNLRPCKLVSLTGYCDGATEKRLQIYIIAGRGLQYLHEFSSDETGIIHGDFKTANVPLTQNWTSKVSDFGFARFCSKFPISEVPTQVKGIEVYIVPAFLQTQMLRRKSDVYAFGVFLLEVLCRKRVPYDIVFGVGGGACCNGHDR
ncbi:putative receptor-like protein kinase At5g38990 [Bidens hawaiensis]|uniref:putative receptor-like protein kinase At5g38990 n=1 Tax=Bidens hawaiensis TaxID=980011 RepID=UPI00404B6490